jgi:hypothetical protein
MKEEYIVKMDQEEVDSIALICSVIGGYPDTTSRSVFAPDDKGSDGIDLEKVSTFHNMIRHELYMELMKYRTGAILFKLKVI